MHSKKAKVGKQLGKRNIEEILQKFRHSLKNTLGKKFSRLILFGSYAREEAESESDIDVAILIKKQLMKEEKNMVSQIASSLSLKHDVVISCVFYLESQYLSWETPFLSNLRREGITL